MLDDIAPRTYIVLFNDAAKAEMAASLLNGGADQRHALIPPVRGLSFFADSDSQDLLGAWWAESVPHHAQPVYLLEHDERLREWVMGLDGTFYVELQQADAAWMYEKMPSVQPVVCGNDLDLVYAALDAANETPGTSGPVLAPELSVVRDEPATAPPNAPAETSEYVHPFDMLAAMLGDSTELPAAVDWQRADAGTRVMRQAAATTREPGERPWSRWWLRPSLRNGRLASRRPAADPKLAQTLTQYGPIVVAVGSRKGGVGKTSHAAGIAIVAGEALDSVGRCAALVDANLANPDAWGQMNLPPGAATVRQTVSSLNVGADPPSPVHATTPALACFPEDRDASEYSRTDIRRLASYLRSRYCVTAVDLSNRLPDATGGAEAAAAAFWVDEADVLLLPTGSSKQEFNGVLDYLEVRGLPPTVVAYIVPRSRRNREHPLTKRYLDAISRRVHAVVPLPDDAERVRYAVMEGVPVQSVSAALGAAYRRLAAAVADAARVPVS